MTDTPIPDATNKAVETAGRWQKYVGERVTAHGGYVGAAKQSFKEIGDGINVFSESSKGHRGLAFKRVGAIGAGAVIAAGALRGKDAEGNDRSGLVRVGQAVLGGGLVAGGLLAGRA